MTNIKKQIFVISVSLGIFIFFLVSIYKNGKENSKEEENIPVDMASQINETVEERKESILEIKKQELVNRINDILNMGNDEPVVAPVYEQPVQTPTPAPRPAPKPKTKVS